MTRRRARAVGWAIGLAVLVVASLALARPGGGQSYGGGGGGGSGGGGGDGDGVGLIIQILIWLVIEFPEVGIPLVIIVIIVMVVSSLTSRSEKGWDATAIPASSAAPPPAWKPPPPRVNPRAALEALRETDPDFSIVVFEDFLQAFWGELLVAQGARRLDTLMPWLAPSVVGSLPFIGGAESVGTPIVGAISYRDVSFEQDRVVVRVTIEGMFSARLAAQFGGHTQSHWVVDDWRLERVRGARSRPPEAAAVFLCPNCGAPAESARTGRCSFCQQVVNDGRFDWVLTRIERTRSETRPPQLTGHFEEQGTNLPTVRAPGVEAALASLGADTGVTFEAFARRLQVAFTELQAGWTARDLARIRPWVTDRQLESMRFWLDAYQAAGLRNVTTNGITNLEIARVTRDRYFDAITVRIYATGVDYTENAQGVVVSGSARAPRPFTEYWTLIRGRAATGPPRADKSCPRCGAPLAIDMGGSCTHCRAHVVRGEFDWVLSRIEQDEAYTG